MFSRDSHSLEHDLSRESQTHAHYLLLALSRAAQAIQRAHTAEDFYNAVGREIQSLGGNVALLLLNDDRQSLSIAHLSYAPGLIRKAEQMTGLSLHTYRLPMTPGGIYERTLHGRTSIFVDSSIDTLQEILPQPVRALSSPLTTIFNLKQGILAPLWVDDEPLGLLKIAGAFLSHDDLPAMDSFAGQIAAGLYNVRLMQTLKDELTARTQAEEALRISQSTFEGIFNSVTETIYIQDENGAFLDVNEGAEKMYGYPREYFIGRTPEFLSAPGRNDLEKIAGYVQQAFRGEPAEFEFWGVRKDGTIFPKDVRLVPGMYFGRKVVIAVARDITERRKAEEELRASQAKIQALLDSIPDMMFVVSREGQYLDYHAISGQLLYVPPSVFLGKNIREIMPADLADSFLSTLEQVFATGEGRLLEYSLDLAGQKQYFEAHVVAYLEDCVLCVIRDVSERNRMEEAVRLAERRFRALIENAPDGISLVGVNGRIKYASPAARGMFDRVSEDYTKDNPLDFIHPDETGMVIEGMKRLVEDPSYMPTFQYRYKHRDGSYHWVESTFSNQLSEPGVEAVVINFKDITKRKEMEKALHESEKYYRALIENATDGIMVVNRKGRISYESPSVARLLGYRAGELLGRNAFDLVNPDDLARIFEEFTNGLAAPGFVHRGEYRLLHSNGGWRYFEIVSRYLIDEPAIMGIIINGRDITERKMAEDALRESEKRFHSIVSESTDGITLTDESGRILEFNHALENLTGMKRDEVLGMYVWDFQMRLVPQDERTEELRLRVTEKFQQVLRDGENSGLHVGEEVLIERADMTRRFVQLRKFSIRTDKGWRLGSIARDVTEKKQAEQALRQQFNNLRSLYQMTAALGQSSDLGEIFSTALDSLQNTLAADRAAVLLLDPDGVMRFKSWRGLSEAYRKVAEGHSPWKPDDPDPQPALVPDAFTDPGLTHLLPAFESEGIRSLGFIPLVHQGRLLGKFMIYFNERHFYHEGEIQIAQTIARHVVFAISRRQADDALRASEEMYRILYEDNPSMYFTADGNGLTLSVNKYGISQLGYAPNELIGRPIVDVFHPDDREGVRLQIESCMENPERMIQIEARKVDKSGGIRWVRESACAVRDIQGQLVVLITCDDITKRKQAEDELRQANRSLQAAHRELQQMFAHEQVLARTDSLTGLINRRHFFELAAREFNSSIRYQRPLALILFDVDGFKRANDTFGHAFGDDTLVKISQVAKSQVREVDILARYGGDEFIILMPETNAAQAFLLAERIRKAVESADIETGELLMSATVSLGIEEMAFATDRSVEAIISRADKALYNAKQSGRNHAVIYSGG
ncbi:MAG: PAS domain S-box protein [Anaerolineales bacterium]|nr:PAS domain S-box protein [Anaerolineales bacterium]